MKDPEYPKAAPKNDPADTIARLRAENERLKNESEARQRTCDTLAKDCEAYRKELAQAEARLAAAVVVLESVTRIAHLTVWKDFGITPKAVQEIDALIATLSARAADLLAVVESARAANVAWKNLSGAEPSQSVFERLMDAQSEALAKLDG